MINSRMTPAEILKEFFKDYHSDLVTNCFGYGNAVKKKLMTKQKSLFGKKNPPDDWWVYASTPRHYRIGPKNIPECCNDYRIHLAMRLVDRFSTVSIMLRVYTILNDSITGKKLLLVFPSEGVKSLIVATSTFLSEYKDQMGLPENAGIQEIVDSFVMINENHYTFYSSKEENLKYNLEIKMKLGWGIGKIERFPDGYSKYTAEHFMSKSLEEKLKEKYGISDPVSIWEREYEHEDEEPDSKPEKYEYSDDYNWEEEERKRKEKILEELETLGY